MRVKVLKSFRDKHTKALHKKGITIDVTKERFEEINSTAHGPFVEEVETGAKASGEKTKKKTVKK